jgi:hypothetical protein
MFYHICSQGQFILVLARPSIKFLILFYWISLIILDYFNFMLVGSKAAYQIDLPSYLMKVSFSLLCIVGSTIINNIIRAEELWTA